MEFLAIWILHVTIADIQRKERPNEVLDEGVRLWTAWTEDLTNGTYEKTNTELVRTGCPELCRFPGH